MLAMVTLLIVPGLLLAVGLMERLERWTTTDPADETEIRTREASPR